MTEYTIEEAAKALKVPPDRIETELRAMGAVTAIGQTGKGFGPGTGHFRQFKTGAPRGSLKVTRMILPKMLKLLKVRLKDGSTEAKDAGI
jgi:hypothetical protein